MKPAPFAYHAPEHLDEAIRLMAEHADDGKPIAGGQSLIPMLNLRLAQPAVLVDLNGVAGLSGLTRRDGRLRIGAMTRQSDLLASSLVARDWPLLVEGAKWIAHPQIRNRGTVGGSLAHADPGAELPVLMTALDARFVARSVRGSREIAADEFFLTHLTTAMEPDELLVEVLVDSPPPRTCMAFTEFARRHGDFALGGAAVVATFADDGSASRLRAVLLAAGATPVRAAAAQASIEGRRLDDASIDEAVCDTERDLTPTSDLHASAAYRRRLLGRMLRDALRTVMSRHRAEAQG